MQSPAPSHGRRARSIALAVVLSATFGLAFAAPDDPLDPVMKLLADKGLSGAGASVASTETPVAAAAAVVAAGPGLMQRVQDRASDMVVSAMNFIGVPYRRGGNSAETGFDCSGFTRKVFEMSLGLALPRRADEQAAAPGLIKVRRDDLKPGDLVFFNTMRRTFSHVGIYIGDNRFIHAPSHGKDVRTDDLSFAYWAKRFTGARRAEMPSTQTAQAATRATVESAAQPTTH
ncbi:MAG: C40 family peptidase [Caldimonas sp.]